jgi:hypothetical protein
LPIHNQLFCFGLNPASQSSPRVPLAVAALAVASGIFIAQHVHRSVNIWGWSAAVLIVCTWSALYKQSTGLARFSVVLALISAGAFTWAAAPPLRIVIPPEQFLGGERVLITGHVTNDGSLLPGGSRERFDLQTETIQLGDAQFNLPARVSRCRRAISTA